MGRMKAEVRLLKNYFPLSCGGRLNLPLSAVKDHVARRLISRPAAFASRISNGVCDSLGAPALLEGCDG